MKNLLRIPVVLIAVFQLTILAPLTARASLISDILTGIEMAGYWPGELPAPDAMLNLIDLASKCSESDILTCVNAAMEDETISQKLGDDKVKVQFGVDVYVDISTGDYLSLILHLGKPAGCFAAAMIVGVPVCSWAEALASIAGAVVDVANEVYAFLQENGASAVWESDDYWDIYYYPQIDLGVQIHLLNPPSKLADAFGALSGPLYKSCYELLEKHHSEEASSEACENLQAQFVVEIHKKLDSFLITGKQKTTSEYDKMKPEWTATWYKRCELTSGAAANADDLIEGCQKKVNESIEMGKGFASEATSDFLIPATVMYDGKAAALAGYKAFKVQSALSNTVKLNEQIELNYQNSASNGGKVLSKIQYETQSFMADTMAWQKQCKAGDHENDCEYEIKKAWYSCQEKIAKVPTLNGDLGNLDTEKIAATKVKCEASYTAVIAAFNKFGEGLGKILVLSKLCPAEPRDSGVLFSAASEQCKKNISAMAEKCGGGVPVFTEDYYKTGVISQNPKAIANCDGDVNALQEKWGQDENLFAKINSAAVAARAYCESKGYGASCEESVKKQEQACRAEVAENANALGILPSLPAYQGEIKAAISKMKDSAVNCAVVIQKIPSEFAKVKKLEEAALAMYGKDCPANKGGKFNYGDQCLTDIIAALKKCQIASPQMETIEHCKPQLQKVIEEYKKKSANSETLSQGAKKSEGTAFEGKAVEAAAPAAPKVRKNLMTAPPSMLGVQKDSTETFIKKDVFHPRAVTLPAAGNGLRKAPIKIPLGGSVRSVTIPVAVTPAKLLEEKGCVLSTNARLSNTYICKTDEGMKLCEEFKSAQKVGGCVKEN